MSAMRSVPTEFTARTRRRKSFFGKAFSKRFIWLIGMFPSSFSAASERGHKSVVDLELHDDLPRAPVHGQDLAEFGIEIIFQHHRPWFFKKKIGSIRDGSAGQNTQFFAIGNMMHDARHSGDVQLAEGARAMAAVV